MKKTTAALALNLAWISCTGLSAADRPAKLEDLAWIVGAWRGTVGEDRLDERWAPPDGGAMMGMFRWVKGEKILVYEFMTIEAGSPPTLKLRHFDAALKGWEDKDSPLRFQLVEWSSESAVFDNLDPRQPIRITYRRTAERSLEVLLEELRDGRPSIQKFQFARD